MSHAPSSLPCKEDFLGFVGVGMAGLAIGYGLYVFDDLVLDLHMAEVAFDFVRRDMRGMHKVCILVFIQTVSLPVAFVTVFSGHLSVTDDGLAVAFVTREAAFEDQRVVKPGYFFGSQIFFVVTMRTIGDSGVVFAFFKMADETGAFSYGDMLSLHDLRMTARASEAFPPLQISKMNLVVEDDFFELSLPL